MRVIAFLTAFAVMAVSWNATAGIKTVAVPHEVDEGHYHQPSADDHHEVVGLPINIGTHTPSGAHTPWEGADEYRLPYADGNPEFVLVIHRDGEHLGSSGFWYVNAQTGAVTLDGVKVGKMHFFREKGNRRAFSAARFVAFHTFPKERFDNLLIPHNKTCGSGYQANIILTFHPGATGAERNVLRRPKLCFASVLLTPKEYLFRVRPTGRRAD